MARLILRRKIRLWRSFNARRRMLDLAPLPFWQWSRLPEARHIRQGLSLLTT